MTAAERRRFDAKFRRGADDECWEWHASLTATGYGQFYFRGRPQKAHRLAYVDFWGPLPADQDVVMHSCDNRTCVNPQHLHAGTVPLNNLDRDRKGRNRIDPAHEVVYANRRARTACKHGHTYTPQTMVLVYPRNRPGPTRRCLVCKKQAEEKARRASKS